MIIWKHIDGSHTVVNSDVSDRQLLRVTEEAVRMMKGQFPSINSKDTVDDLLEFIDNNEL